jgi:hypothetical protein
MNAIPQHKHGKAKFRSVYSAGCQNFLGCQARRRNGQPHQQNAQQAIPCVIESLSPLWHLPGMLIHRYFASHAFETLKEEKLKTSRITDFNDPFEFQFCTKGQITPKMAREYFNSRLDDPNFWLVVAQRMPDLITSSNPRKLLKLRAPTIIANLVASSAQIVALPLQLREQMADRTTRVVSFSDANVSPQNEILLWSHYANKHEGIRIGFEFPPEIKHPFKIFQVQYREGLFEIVYSPDKPILDVGYALVECAKVKSSAWQYEHEYRLLTHPDLCEKRTMPNSKIESFIGFEREWVKTVDFGVRCSTNEIAKMSDLLTSQYAGTVVCRKAGFHKSEYALVYEPV